MLRNEGQCPSFSLMPCSVRLVYTLTLLVLGIAYLFAMIHTFASHAGRDGDPMLSVEDLAIAYSGKPGDTRLEAALKGPMSGMLPRDEVAVIVSWVHSGASKEDYEANVLPIFEQRCAMCHGGSNPHLPLLAGYDKLMKMVEIDHGMDMVTLVRVSHIHLFGMTFIFYIVSMIFCHARVTPGWLKGAIIAIPFIAIMLDVASWYVTKLYPPFAWVVFASGLLMALCFLLEWLISIYQMWFGGRHNSEPSGA